MNEVIIIGAGPAGLMTGIMSKKNTLIIEKNNSAGKKLLITGGGRCNITNNKDNKEFLNNIDNNKKYLYSTIFNFGPQEIIDFFNKNNVKLKEEENNKMFPVSNKAYTILECLLNNYNGKINYNEEVLSISKINDNYKVITNKNIYEAQKVVIATGGSSFPKTGSSGDNMKFAKSLLQPTIRLYPAEVGLDLTEKIDIPGSSISNVSIKVDKTVKNGSLIFTHRGLSGESIMLISEYVYKLNKDTIEIDFFPDIDIENLESSIKIYDREKEIHTFFEQFFSKKITEYLISKINLEKNAKIKQLCKTDYKKISHLKKMTFNIKKTNILDQAYVTGGGIDMKYINSKNMESTINKGLFFVGEALDIHGPIGGYNLTLALSTGYTAGINL